METEKNVPWKKALREIFGGRLESDRVALFRQVWRAQLNAKAAIFGSAPDNTEQIIALWKREGMPPAWIAGLKDDFAKWRKLRDANQRRGAALARWNAKRKKVSESVLTPRKPAKLARRIR